MKKLIFILLGGVILSCAIFAQSQNRNRRNAARQAEAVQPTPTVTGPHITFDRSEHNFGTVREEVGTVSTDFEFTNTGTAPVLIHRVSVGCGCQTPRYPREPILPGETRVIIMEYHTTGRPGAFSRSAIVHTNVPDTVFTLWVRGTVTPRQ